MCTRIVLVLSTFPQLSETFIVNKFLGLLESGWDVHIVCGQFSQAGWDAFSRLKSRPELRKRIHRSFPVKQKWLIAFLYLPVFLLVLFTAPANTLMYFYRCWKLHRLDVFRRFYMDATILRLKPQVVHMEFGSVAVGRETLGKAIGSKLIVSFRGFDLNFIGLEKPDYYTMAWKYADGLHFLGNDLWQRAVRRRCPPSKKHVLIPPAIDVEYFSRNDLTDQDRLGSNQRPFRILSVGRAQWKKGYEYALQAVKELTDKGIACEYHIVGGGDYLEALSFARHQMGLENIATFLGSMPRERVKEQYEWADAFLHSAVSEGFCNAVIEAQAMQLPVVCTDAGGLSENVEDGITGFVVPRRDYRIMAEKLECLAGDENLRKKMGFAGRRRAVEKFSIIDQIESFDRFYRQVLGVFS